MSFFDWIRGKGYKSRRRSEPRLSKNASDKEIRAMIALLLDDDDASYAYQALLAHGRATLPEVERAVIDPRFRVFKSKPHLAGIYPYNAIFKLLTVFGSPMALREALRLIESPDPYLLNVGVEFSLSAGRADAFAKVWPKLSDALRNEVEYHIRWGVQYAIAEGRADSQFRSLVYPVLLEIATERNHYNVGAPELMFELHPSQAAVDLNTDRALSISTPQSSDILQALVANDVAIPDERLFRFLSEAEESPDAYPNNSIIASILQHLAKRRHPKAREVAARHRDGKADRRWEAAYEALCLLEGIEADKAVYERRKLVGESKMPRPLQLYYAVLILDGEVRNGGFLQYFSNPSGETVYRALEALQEMNAPACCQILQEAIHVFGPDGVSADRDARNDLLANVMDLPDNTFGKLDGRWYDADDRLRARMFEFALRHKEHFRLTN